MNELPEYVYDRLLSMKDDEFQREYTYIHRHLSPETVVEFGGYFGWNHVELTHPSSVGVYQTTVEVAMLIMDDLSKVRLL